MNSWFLVRHQPRAYISECGLTRMAEDCPLATQGLGVVEGGVEGGGGGPGGDGDELMVSSHDCVMHSR